MPVFFLGYLVVEAVAFFAVSKIIGVGWALLSIFALIFLGVVCASSALRQALARASKGRSSVGELAGDSALLLTAWVLNLVPGFVTGAIGLLLVFPPTRHLLSRVLSRKMSRGIEDFGVRVYNASPMSRFSTQYGSFTAPSSSVGTESSDAVIDADQIEEWFKSEAERKNNDGKPE